LAPGANERLREIVEGFFFRRLTGEDGKRIRWLLVKSPPGLGKTREAIGWAYHLRQTDPAPQIKAPKIRRNPKKFQTAV
jgi:hypothetical protein